MVRTIEPLFQTYLPLFVFQQLLFDDHSGETSWTGRVVAHPSRGRRDSMAGDQKRKGIPGDCLADRPSSSRFADLHGQLPIGFRHSAGYPAD